MDEREIGIAEIAAHFGVGREEAKELYEIREALQRASDVFAQAIAKLEGETGDN